jgi:hypothetical protein
MIAGAQQTSLRGPQAHVPGRVSRRVHDLPGTAAGGELLTPTKCLVGVASTYDLAGDPEMINLRMCHDHARQP